VRRRLLLFLVSYAENADDGCGCQSKAHGVERRNLPRQQWRPLALFGLLVAQALEVGPDAESVQDVVSNQASMYLVFIQSAVELECPFRFASIPPSFDMLLFLVLATTNRRCDTLQSRLDSHPPE